MFLRLGVKMRKIKIAQIGTSENSHGRTIFKSLKEQSDVFEIVGYAFPEREGEKFADQMPYFEGYAELTVEEILQNPEIEAVTIETEEVYLTKYAQMAADAGKHIHMEKPGGIDLADFEKLINTMKNSGKVFHTGYMYRYNPCVVELIDKVRSGKLGEILSVEAQMNCSHNKETRQWMENFPGGILFFLGCHLIDLILLIQGMPKRVIPLNKCTGADGVTAEDFGMAVFEYDKGVAFAKVNALEAGGFFRRQLVVSGTKGTVELRPLEAYSGEPGSLLYTTKRECYSFDWVDRGESTDSEVYERYDKMMGSFGAMVRGEKVNPYSYDYELNLYRTILEACGRSF